MSRQPRIAMTMRLELSSDRFYLGRDYCEALQAAGATPLHIGLIPDKSYISDVLDSIDGVLLPGSDTDVDPALYGEEPHKKFKRSIPVKDNTDLMVLEEAEKRDLPLLAICYGMQALNVYSGGSLIQDIDSEVSGAFKHDQGEPLERLSHGIKIAEGSRLSELAGGEQHRVNSHHHQAVKSLGRGLVATAVSGDGIIEAVEGTDPERFLLGVQWHPELTYKFDRLSGEIFKVFVEACGENIRQSL